MPTMTAPAPTSAAWYQCQDCRVKTGHVDPANPDRALAKALRHVAEEHNVKYPDSLSMVVEHLPKS